MISRGFNSQSIIIIIYKGILCFFCLLVMNDTLSYYFCNCGYFLFIQWFLYGKTHYNDQNYILNFYIFTLKMYSFLFKPVKIIIDTSISSWISLLTSLNMAETNKSNQFMGFFHC